MGIYLSPLVTEGQIRQEGLQTVALSATEVFTTPNKDDYNGAIYEAYVYVRVNTLDGGTTPTIAISLVATEGASARTLVVPLATEAGAYAATLSLAAATSAHGKVTFRADKNTAVNWVRTAGGTPSNNGNFDVFIIINRIG